MPLPLGPKQPRGRDALTSSPCAGDRKGGGTARNHGANIDICCNPEAARGRHSVVVAARLAVPEQFSRPPMLPPCRGGCFRRCCGLAQDAPLPRDAAPPSDPLLQNTIGDPSLAHHPFHGRRVSFGCGGRSARTVPLVDGVRRWRQGQVRLEYRQSRRRQACKRRAADVRGGGRRGRSSL